MKTWCRSTVGYTKGVRDDRILTTNSSPNNLPSRGAASTLVVTTTLIVTNGLRDGRGEVLRSI